MLLWHPKRTQILSESPLRLWARRSHLYLDRELSLDCVVLLEGLLFRETPAHLKFRRTADLQDATNFAIAHRPLFSSLLRPTSFLCLQAAYQSLYGRSPRACSFRLFRSPAFQVELRGRRHAAQAQ